MFGDRLAQAFDRGVESLAVVALQLTGVGHDEFLDQRDHAAVLRGHGLGVDLRHPRRVEILAHLREQARQLLHACSGRFQALGQRREFARHQVVDRAAGDAAVDLRIPGPALQGFDVPDVRTQLVAQDRGIDLVLAREFRDVEGFQLGQRLFREVERLRAAFGAEVVDLGIEAVLALLGGEDRVEGEGAVQPAFAQIGEFRVERGIGGGRRRGGAGGRFRGVGGFLAAGGDGHGDCCGEQGGGERSEAHGRSPGGRNPQAYAGSRGCASARLRMALIRRRAERR